MAPRERSRPFATWVVLLLAIGATLRVEAAPEGQITWASPVTVVPVLRVIADDATRLIALKRGEVDVAYAIRGPLAEDLRRTARRPAQGGAG